MLSRYSTPDTGEVEYRHSRIWEDYDHEPDPVLARTRDQGTVCDFCGDAEPVCVYVIGADISIELREGERLREKVGYGNSYSACATCDVFVKRGDLDGLTEYCNNTPTHFKIIRKLAEQRGRPATTADIEAQRRHRIQLHRTILGLKPRRNPLPPPPAPPAELAPQRLPRIRDRLVRYWGAPGTIELFTGAGRTIPVNVPGEDCGVPGRFAVGVRGLSAEVATRFCTRKRHAVDAAELYWVSREFTALAVAAGTKLPDFSVAPEDLPAPAGLLVWQEPVRAMDVPNIGTAEVRAVSWTRLEDGVWLTMYCQPEQLYPLHDRSAVREQFGYLMPIAPGAGTRFVQNKAIASEHLAESGWGTILATWFLMKQPGVATTTTESLPRKEARAYARAGRTAPTVRIIDLRRQATTAAATANGAGSGRSFSYSVRFLVGGDTGGFWKDQAYGPKHGQRRRIWIAPYLKGPQGAPLKLPPATVKVLR